jgi:integrase
MKVTRSRNKSPEAWPHKVSLGRVSVTVYRRVRGDGSYGFEVANYSSGKRRLESFPDEASALFHANKLARQLSECQVVAANLTNDQAAEYASIAQALAPYGVSLPAAASTLAECLKLVGDLPNLHAAAQFYATRNRKVQRKRVSEIVTDLIDLKTKRGSSERYIEDLRARLNTFAESFQKDACDVTTSEIQAWLDSKQRSPQTYMNFRQVIHLLFEHAVARGFAADNPAAKVETRKVRPGVTQIFTPVEIAKLLGAADEAFLPSLAIGAFAGLRSAEIEKIQWEDIRLAERNLVVTAANAKTASRRVVPIAANLVEWLTPFKRDAGPVWAGGHDAFYDAEKATAEAAGVSWKQNALRHSYASYRFAQIGDAGRVAGELGNSAAMVHRHYRELVTATEAKQWFEIRPNKEGAKILPLPAAVAA